MAVSNGFTYSLDGSNQATITAYDPTSSSYAYAPTIPSTLDGYTVIGIGTSAFSGKSLTSVTINTAINLGDLAFDNNSGIDVNINANVTTTTIGSNTDAPFYRCSIGSGLTIQSGCTTIPQSLFRNCGLTSVTLPSTLTVIDDYAFNSNSIGSLTFSYAVDLGDRCFGSNGSISVTINANVTTTKVSSYLNGPFKSCTIGGNLTIQSSCTTIPVYLFAECGLTSLTIPSTLTTIDDYGFYSNSLGSVTFDNAVDLGDQCFAYNGSVEVSLNANITTSKVSNYTYGPFKGCTIGTHLTIEDGCTTVPYYLFASSGLTSLSIPSSVTTIKYYAFYSNTIASLTIPSTLTSIEDEAFNFNSITSLTFNNAVDLGDNTFANNTNLTLTINANITTSMVSSYLNPPFKSCNVGSNLTIQSGCTALPAYIFDKAGLTSADVPSSVTSIGAYAFYDNDALRSIYIRNSNCTFGSSSLGDSTPTSPKGTIYGYANSTARTWANSYTTNYMFYAWYTLTDTVKITSTGIEAPVLSSTTYYKTATSTVNLTDTGIKSIKEIKSTTVAITDTTLKKVKSIFRGILNISDNKQIKISILKNIINNINTSTLKLIHTFKDDSLGVLSNVSNKIYSISSSSINITTGILKGTKKSMSSALSLTSNILKSIKAYMQSNIMLTSLIDTLYKPAVMLYQISLTASITIVTSTIKTSTKVLNSILSISNIGIKKITALKISYLNVSNTMLRGINVIKVTFVDIQSTSIKLIRFIRESVIHVNTSILKQIKKYLVTILNTLSTLTMYRRVSLILTSLVNSISTVTSTKTIRSILNSLLSLIGKAVKKTTRYSKDEIQELIDYLIYIEEVSGFGVDVYRDFEPDYPINIITIYEEESGHITSDGETIVKHLQIVVRDSSATLAKTRVDRLYTIFNPLNRYLQLINKTCILEAKGAPLKLDSKQEHSVKYSFKVSLVLTDEQSTLSDVAFPVENVETNLLKDISTYLTGIGNITGDGIDCFRNFSPENPDNITILYEYQSGNSVIHDTILHRSVQMVVRNKSALLARTKAETLYDIFNVVDNKLQIGDRNCIISLRNSPFKLKIDDRNRYYYAFNIGIVTERDQ